MGFNISGLAINRNYEAGFDNLQQALGWNLEKQSEIDFETASSNWKDDGICDVYFSEKGTLIFLSIDKCAQSWPLPNDNTLTFALSETSMAFSINYCENGVEKRSIMEVNGDRMEEEGEKLAVESQSADASEIIWNQLGVVIGKSFWEIEADERAVRYVFSDVQKSVPEPQREVPDAEQKTKAPLTQTGSVGRSKKWWQFWK